MEDEMIKEALSYSLGSDMHEVWRNSRKKEDGTYEPKMKKTKDEEWILSHGTNEVDIANCTFEELPSDWQNENLKASEVALGQVYEKVLSDEPITDEEMEQMGSHIHEEWLKRNKWVYDPNYGNYSLTLPYEKLSKEEQDIRIKHKYIQQLRR